ncbi:hypothetical protein THASP1DRAFT_22135 [Thamnocephalis sphaerospora]|uniref:Uncharacterized protein n=1 Tax=Thamnocephalis sphaerospora TaxID=78915 RepID=A0A4P9XV55_9FUNG|nr:hypothetical protein THASP1DRAFT_22135 [Thamnocephalis sphaerospora]|eukprot:RKP10126.1 hypothetical protein THASP1DRAFT_22135 [Thamnocephalis sphaerospora]
MCGAADARPRLRPLPAAPVLAAVPAATTALQELHFNGNALRAAPLSLFIEAVAVQADGCRQEHVTSQEQTGGNVGSGNEASHMQSGLAGISGLEQDSRRSQRTVNTRTHTVANERVWLNKQTCAHLVDELATRQAGIQHQSM